MTKRLSPTTLPPSEDPATKAQRVKVVLTKIKDVEAPETLVPPHPTSRLDHATTVPKAKAIPTSHTLKAKVKTTLPPAIMATANPN